MVSEVKELGREWKGGVLSDEKNRNKGDMHPISKR